MEEQVKKVQNGEMRNWQYHCKIAQSWKRISRLEIQNACMPARVLVKVTRTEGGINMDNTNEYVQKLNEQQKKQEQNKKRQGNGSPSEKLPTNRH